MKGKALRRALATAYAVRINTNLPAIVDSTMLISPEDAKEMLEKNKNNRPINWRRVEEYADIMRSGDWKLHPQGIILDGEGNILTGQTRLWAVIYAGVAVYMRVSRGSPPETAFVIDRGRPQSARDLSTRRTARKHSPVEASIARCLCVLRGDTRPSVDQIALVLSESDAMLKEIMRETAGTKKDKAMLMVLGAIVATAKNLDAMRSLTAKARVFADRLELALTPYSSSSCWGKGVSFGMALEKAREIVGQNK